MKTPNPSWIRGRFLCCSWSGDATTEEFEVAGFIFVEAYTNRHEKRGLLSYQVRALDVDKERVSLDLSNVSLCEEFFGVGTSFGFRLESRAFHSPIAVDDGCL